MSDCIWVLGVSWVYEYIWLSVWGCLRGIWMFGYIRGSQYQEYLCVGGLWKCLGVWSVWDCLG